MRISLPLPFAPRSRSAPEPSSYTWLSARAQNALNHLTVISVVTGITFVAVLMGLVLIPRRASRASHAAIAHIGVRSDTTSMLATRAQAAAALTRIDSGLAAARRVVASSAPPSPPPVDTLPTALRAERDSLNALVTALEAAMAHAAEAPLPPAFRELAQTPALQSSSQVHVWLDSLDMVDKLRAPFGALGAGDPIYVTLTARVNELGRSIRDAAEQKRSELLARIAPLTPAPVAPPPPITTPRIDTTRLTALRDSATRLYAATTRTLDSMRTRNAQIDLAMKQARDIENIGAGASPAAMLAAAIVMALVLGFSVSFASELRYPRIAHAREAAATANTRILVTLHASDNVDRNRRLSPINVVPLGESGSDNYRTLYLHLAATNATIPMVTVTGDNMPIVATVATNLAAVAAYEARSTLLIDVDTKSDAVASILRIPSKPGLSSVLAGATTLTDAIVTTTIGRDHLEVIPSGPVQTNVTPLDSGEQLRTDIARLEQRYDFIVIAAPTTYVQAARSLISTPEVILCARLGDTRLTDLSSAAQSLRGAGRFVHGVVLWDDDTPRI